MGRLSSDLKEMGYERTERESPFSEDGVLWSKGYEVVCDETAIIITGRENPFRREEDTEREVYRYRNSERVKLAGGYTGSYDWGSENGRFTYGDD